MNKKLNQIFKYLQIKINEIINLRPLAIFIGLLFILTICTLSYIDNTNSASRFLTMDSLVTRGSFILDGKHIYTDDKMVRDQNYYSSKPPVLSAIGGGIYYILHNVFSLNLPGQTYFGTPNITVYIITLLLVGIPYYLLLVYFYKTMLLLKIDGRYHNALLFGLGLGTLCFTYSRTLNNHMAASACLYIAFYYLLKLKLIKNNKAIKYLMLAGFCASLAAVIELQAGIIFLFIFFIYILFIMPKIKSVYYLLAATPILIIHLYLNFQITGDYKPAQLHPEFAYELPNQLENKKFLVWNQLAGVGETYQQNKLVYTFNILLGTHGLFLYSPILLFAVYALYKIIRKKSHQFWHEAIIIAAGLLLLLIFYIFKIHIYTGSAFGFRWYVSITPLLYFFIIFLFKGKSAINFINAFYIILITSIMISFIGYLNPWPRSLIKITSPFNSSETILNFPLAASLNDIAKKIKTGLHHDL